MEGLDYRDTVTDFDLPEGTFFDCAVVHVLTTATLDRLRELFPQGRFEARRFRPNIVVSDLRRVGTSSRRPGSGARSRSATRCAWRHRPLRPLRDDDTAPGGPAQGPGHPPTAAQHNEVNVGVYASVLRGGEIRRGDAVRLE